MNELWSSRNNPEDLRIAEIFDEDETLWILDANAEPVVITGVDAESHQGFVMRFKCQRRDKTVFATKPMFFDHQLLRWLQEGVIEEFKGFGEQ